MAVVVLVGALLVGALQVAGSVVIVAVIVTITAGILCTGTVTGSLVLALSVFSVEDQQTDLNLIATQTHR